jgi:hypothetical protein
MGYRFSHVAVTVGREMFVGAAREQLLLFYRDVFGWQENPGLAIPGERILLRAPTDVQYVTIRAADAPMVTSGYEHLGILVETEAELHEIHQRAAAFTSRFPDLQLDPVKTGYGGALVSFRCRFRLPLTMEVQHLKRSS